MLGNLPGLDVHVGSRVRRRRLPALLRADGAHACSASQRAHRRRQPARGAPERARRAAPDRSSPALLAGAAAGLAGMVEVAAIHGNANASLMAGYGYAGILVAFLAAAQRAGHPAGRAPARRHQRQRRPLAAHVRPARRHRQRACRASCSWCLLASETYRGQAAPGGRARRLDRWMTLLSTLGLWGIPLAVLGGALRVSAPFLFVSLGECITEKSGRVNLGLEGTLVMGAMSGYGVSYLTGSAWLGVLAAGRRRRRVRRAARLAVRPAARQRHRGRHRADAVRHRPGVLSGQAADPAHGAAPAGDPARHLQRQPRRCARRCK